MACLNAKFRIVEAKASRTVQSNMAKPLEEGSWRSRHTVSGRASSIVQSTGNDDGRAGNCGDERGPVFRDGQRIAIQT